MFHVKPFSPALRIAAMFHVKHLCVNPTDPDFVASAHDARLPRMRITIAAVGKWKDGPERALFEEYTGRLKWPLALKEVEEHRTVPPPQLKSREAELLLAALPKAGSGARMVALDERGKALSSEQLAKHVRQWRDGGTDDRPSSSAAPTASASPCGRRPTSSCPWAP